MVRTITLCLGFVILPSVAFGQVYKCTDAAGRVAYQNIPCVAARQDHPVILQSSQPNTGSYTNNRTPAPAPHQPPQPQPNPQQPQTTVNNYQTVVIQQDDSARDTPPQGKQEACDWARDKRSKTEKYYRSHSIEMPWQVKHDLDDLVFEKC